MDSRAVGGSPGLSTHGESSEQDEIVVAFSRTLPRCTNEGRLDMANVDVRRSDKHQIRGAEGVGGEDQRQALLDSVTKSEHMKSKSSLSPLSSDFSSGNSFFQLDGAKLSKPVNSERNTLSAGLLKVLDATRPSTGVGSHAPSEVDSRIDKAPGDGNPSSAAEAGDPEVSTPPGVEPTPQGQHAGKPEGYDPNRIPASVFSAKKSLSSIDWSLASNESLFSIRMESCSFSRDHLMGRSGELGSFSYSPPATDASDSPLPLSVDPEEVHLVAGNDPEQDAATEQVNAQTMVDVLRAAAGEHSGEFLPADEGICPSASNHRQSDASSVHSFAFP
ncbi:hypothetical protein Taro_018895, partial [Colocasia esculenta]|nr:hypothetical protein [Colocasia esculenta]